MRDCHKLKQIVVLTADVVLHMDSLLEQSQELHM